MITTPSATGARLVARHPCGQYRALAAAPARRARPLPDIGRRPAGPASSLRRPPTCRLLHTTRAPVDEDLQPELAMADFSQLHPHNSPSRRPAAAAALGPSAAGRPVPGDRQAVAGALERVHPVPGVPARGQAGDLHHEPDRVDERPAAQGDPQPRPVPHGRTLPCPAYSLVVLRQTVPAKLSGAALSSTTRHGLLTAVRNVVRVQEVGSG